MLIGLAGHSFIPRRPEKTRKDPKRPEKTRKDPKRHSKRHPKRPEKRFLLFIFYYLFICHKQIDSNNPFNQMKEMNASVCIFSF